MSQSHISRIANTIIQQAIERGVAAVWLEPTEERLAVRYRIDGKQCHELSLPMHLHPELVNRYKNFQRPNLLTWLNSRERHYQIWDEEQELDLHITFLPTPHGEKVMMSILPTGWKSEWRRRRRRLSAAMARVVDLLKREVRCFAGCILDLGRLVLVVLPSAVLARLGVPFAQPLEYWTVRYWGIEAELMGVRLPDRDLDGVNLAFANLEAADLSRTSLRNASLIHARLAKANLRGAVLTRAILQNADLREADLREADIQEAALSQANLQDAVLSGADLRGAYLSRWWCYKGKEGETWTGCDNGTDLRRADLTGANLTGALFDHTTLWPEGFDPQRHGAVRRREVGENEEHCTERGDTSRL